MLGEDTKLSQLKPCYFRGKLDNHFEKFVEVVHRLSVNVPLLDALQVPRYSRNFKDVLANKYEIATLRVDHVNNVVPLLRRTREARRPRMPDDSMFCWFI
jgi:hypothetical protein